MIDAWMPTRYSAPLPDSPGSVFDKFERLLDLVWRIAFGYTLDPWQKFTLRLVTELRHDGRLRHRQFIIMVGRQNGKTEIMAALAIMWLLWLPVSLVVGIASDAEQARLIYDRARKAVAANVSLAARFTRNTETRGLRTKAGGEYKIKASKSAAIQGSPIGLGAVDEVHIVKRGLWFDLVNGLGGRPNCMVVGISTAGDDSSELLLHLLDLFDKGQIGGAIWEAPEARIPEDDDELWAYLLAANPSLHSARSDRQAILEDVRNTPPADAIRYRLNRFVSSTSAYMTLGQWHPLAGDVTPPPSGVTLVIDRTPSWSHASATAAWKAADGKIETQIVASIANPTMDSLVDLSLALADRVGEYAADGLALGKLVEDLKRRGLNARKITLGDHTGAASRLYARVQNGSIRHAGDPLVSAQIPGVKTKFIGDAYRLVRASKDYDIDAVVGTAAAVYLAESSPATGTQLFI